MMKKMVILERLVLELYLDMVLDTHTLGPGRLSGDNHDHEDINWNGLGSIGTISMSGNTIHDDHCGDLTKFMSPNGICCVCDQGY